jgi:hypothetical protein
MKYEEFLSKNKKLKGRVPTLTIDKVSYKEDKGYLTDGQVYPLTKIVDAVSEGRVWLSNPSKISTWGGFKTPKVNDKKVVKKESKYPFEIVERTPDKIILEVLAKDSLAVAKYPYVSAEWDYITVTRGKEHVLTIVDNNGSRFDFYWGESGYTLISESLKKLKLAVIDYLEKENYILLDWDDGKVNQASICYNGNFESWQLKLEGYRYGSTIRAFARDKKIRSVEEMIEYAKHFVNVKGWEKVKAETGIDLWKAKL